MYNIKTYLLMYKLTKQLHYLRTAKRLAIMYKGERTITYILNRAG